MLEYQQLKEILPHAFPFLLIDRVDEYKEGESLTASKNITSNEWCVAGDCGSNAPDEKRGNSNFPEVLLIEAAAQAALVLYHVSKVKGGQRKYVLGRIKAELNSEVGVGDKLKILAFADKLLDTGGYSTINLFSNDQKIGEVIIIYSVSRFNL